MLSQIRLAQIAGEDCDLPLPAHFEGEIMKGHSCHKHGGSSRGEGPETSMKYLNPDSFKVDPCVPLPSLHLHRLVALHTRTQAFVSHKRCRDDSIDDSLVQSPPSFLSLVLPCSSVTCREIEALYLSLP